MDLDRRVRRGRERLAQEVEPAAPPPLTAEKSEQLSVLEEKIKNLLEQVESLGEAGKVDEAEALMRKVLKMMQHLSSHAFAIDKFIKLLWPQLQIQTYKDLSLDDSNNFRFKVHIVFNCLLQVETLNAEKTALTQPQNDKVLMLAQEKKMALCEICGSFLVANDAAERTQSHITGKQHVGYGMVRDFINEYKVNFVLQY